MKIVEKVRHQTTRNPHIELKSYRIIDTIYDTYRDTFMVRIPAKTVLFKGDFVKHDHCALWKLVRPNYEIFRYTNF